MIAARSHTSAHNERAETGRTVVLRYSVPVLSFFRSSRPALIATRVVYNAYALTMSFPPCSSPSALRLSLYPSLSLSTAPFLRRADNAIEQRHTHYRAHTLTESTRPDRVKRLFSFTPGLRVQCARHAKNTVVAPGRLLRARRAAIFLLC